MILSARERLIIALTLVAVALFVLDRYFLTAMLESHSQAVVNKKRLQDDMDHSSGLLARREQIEQRWQSVLDYGLKKDPTEAESQLLHALGDWSAEAGLALSSLRPERATSPVPLESKTDKSDLWEINCYIVGRGPLASVSRFLWLAETAQMPIKLSSVQLRTREDGTDDLTLQVQLSTLYLAADKTYDRQDGRGQ